MTNEPGDGVWELKAVMLKMGISVSVTSLDNNYTTISVSNAAHQHSIILHGFIGKYGPDVPYDPADEMGNMGS